MEYKPKLKLSKNNLAVLSLYTWFRITSFEIENKSKKNLILGSMAYSQGYIDELIQEIKKPIRPIYISESIKLLLEEDKNNLEDNKKNSEENSFINDNNNLNNDNNKRNVDLIFIALEHFKGMVEYKNYNKLLPDEIEKISRYIKYKFYPKDSYIFKEGDEAESLFFIIKGKVQIIERKYIDRTKELKGVYIGEKKLDQLNEDISEENDEENRETNKSNDVLLDFQNNKRKLSYNNLEDIENEIILEPYWKTKDSMLLSSVKSKKYLQKIIDKYDPDENEFLISKSSENIKIKNNNFNFEFGSDLSQNTDKIEQSNFKDSENIKNDFNDSKNSLASIKKYNKEKNNLNINSKKLFQNKQKKIKFKLNEPNPIKFKIKNSSKLKRRHSNPNKKLFLKNYDKKGLFGELVDNIYNNQLKSKKSNFSKRNKRRFSFETMLIKKVEKNIKSLFSFNENEKTKDKIKKKEKFDRNENKIFNFNTNEEKKETPKIMFVRKLHKSKTIMISDKKDVFQRSMQINLNDNKNEDKNSNQLSNQKLNTISKCKLEMNLTNKNKKLNYLDISKKRHNDNNKDNEELLLKKNLLHYGIILKEQDYFGEEPLKYDTLHEYSAFCVTDVHLFILDKEFYNMLLLEKVTKSEKRMSKFIQKIFPLLKQKPKYVSLIKQLRPNFVNKGKYIYTTFDKADYLYLIYQGECALVEPLENLGNKKDFLIEKSKYKIISILKEGAIAGYESCSFNEKIQKRILKNYENCLIVTGNFAIVFKIPVDDFFGIDNLFLNSMDKIKKQREKFSAMKIALAAQKMKKNITPLQQNKKRGNSSNIFNFYKFPEILKPKENSTNKNTNNLNKKLKNCQIINIDNIRSIVYHNRDNKNENEKKKANALNLNKTDNMNITSTSFKKKNNNKINSYDKKIKLVIKTNIKKEFYNINSEKKNKNNNYLSHYLNKKDSIPFLKSDRESSYKIKKNSEKTKLKLFKIKKNLLNKKIFNEKSENASVGEELKNQINSYQNKLENTKKIFSPIKKSIFFNKPFKELIEDKKNSQNILNKNHMSGKNIIKENNSKEDVLNNNKSVREINYLRDKNKRLSSMIRKYYNKKKKKLKKISFMEDKNVFFNSGDFTLPFVYKLISHRESNNKK